VQEELSFISTATYLLSSNTRTLGRTHENDERRSRRDRKLAIMVDADEEGYLLQIF
jgi:hypothetical protein